MALSDPIQPGPVVKRREENKYFFFKIITWTLQFFSVVSLKIANTALCSPEGTKQFSILTWMIGQHVIEVS